MGVNQHKGLEVTYDNVKGDQLPKETIKAPQGNSKRTALRKLRTEAEKSPKIKALYEEVKADKISCPLYTYKEKATMDPKKVVNLMKIMV